MKGRYLCAGVMALLAVTSAYADPPKGFEEFRKGIMNDFNNFKSRILDHYADFLAGEWHEYESLEASEKYSAPKPSAMPMMELTDITEGDEQKKELLGTYGFISPNLRQEVPKSESAFLSWIRNTANLYNSPVPVMKETEVDVDKVIVGGAPKRVGDVEVPLNGNIVTVDGLVNDTDGDIFDFYGMQFALPKFDFKAVSHINEAYGYATQWKLLEEQEVAKTLLPYFKRIQEITGISDYLLFELIMAYADGKLTESNDAAKMGFTHYILANMEFDVRIALDEDGYPFILIPFDEHIHGRSYFPFTENNYFIYSTPGRPETVRKSLRTPTLPVEAGLGKPLHLRMDGLTLPSNPFHYSFEHQGLKIEGELNQNLIPIVYKYPQMETGSFASSMLSKELREDVINQIKSQLADEDPLKAADRLLAMIQFAFPYATDHEFHGFEKPYFFEEILFYPLSDCEDRSIFYSYLLWNALGLENDLIAYPNHEATALRADKVWGGNSHYIRDGRKFFISDPTFQGAPTGMGMSRYESVEPVIDLSYSNEQQP